MSRKFEAYCFLVLTIIAFVLAFISLVVSLYGSWQFLH